VTSQEFDPRAEAVVSEGRDVRALEQKASCAPGRGDTAAIVDYDLHRVDVEATCGARCLLVLTDLWYPGWHVSIDSAPAEMVRVNVLFRGVWLEPGRHRVSYRYRPGSFFAGLSLTGLAVGATLVVWIWRARRGPRARLARPI
jgi:hypothetical protein